MGDNIPLAEWSGSGATRELHTSITKFNEETARQTRQLIILTWIIAVLTAVMAIGVVLQIVLALKALPSAA